MGEWTPNSKNNSGWVPDKEETPGFTPDKPEVAAAGLVRPPTERPQPPADISEMGPTFRGWKRGVEQLQATGYGALGLAGAAVDYEPLKKYGFEGYMRNLKEAEQYPKEVGFFDIKSPGNVITWMKETIGELGPSMLEAGVTAAIGAGVGSAIATPGPGTVTGGVAGFFGKRAVAKMLEETAKQFVTRNVAKGMTKEAAEKLAVPFATQYVEKIGLSAIQKQAMKAAGAKAGVVAGVAPIEAGGNWGENMEKGIDNPWSALATGTAAGFLELAGGNLRIIDTVLGRRFAKEARDAIKDRAPGIVARIFAEAARQAPAEFMQEAGQELLSMVNVAVNDPTFEVFTVDNVKRLVESGMAGALAGGIGGISGVVRGRVNPVTERLKTDPMAGRIEELLAELDPEGTLQIPIPAVDKAIAKETGIKQVSALLEPSPEDLVAPGPSGEAMAALESDYAEQAEALGVRYLGMNPGSPEGGIPPFPEFDTPDVGNFTLQGDETVEDALARKTEQFKPAEEEIVSPPTAEKITIFPGVPFNRLEEYVQEAKDRGYPDAAFVQDPDGKEGRVVASVSEAAIPMKVIRGKTAFTVPQKEALQSKEDNKSAVMGLVKNKTITPEHAVRFTNLRELDSIVKTDTLYVGRDFEGREGISAQKVQDGENLVAYGKNDEMSAAIIFPKEASEGIGEGDNEVKINPNTDLNNLQFVVGGKVVPYSALAETLKGIEIVPVTAKVKEAALEEAKQPREIISKAETGKEITVDAYRGIRGEQTPGTGTFHAIDPESAKTYVRKVDPTTEDLTKTKVTLKNPLVINGGQRELVHKLYLDNVVDKKDLKEAIRLLDVVAKSESEHIGGEAGYQELDTEINHIVRKMGYDGIVYRKADDISFGKITNASEVVVLSTPKLEGKGAVAVRAKITEKKATVLQDKIDKLEDRIDTANNADTPNDALIEKLEKQRDTLQGQLDDITGVAEPGMKELTAAEMYDYQKELKLSEEVKAAVGKIKSIAQRLGDVNIGEIKSLDESREVNYSTPEGKRIIDAWGLSEEELNAIRSGERVVYIAAQHTVHEVPAKDGGSQKQSDITFYRRHTARDAYHEGGHALHSQGYLRDQFPTDSIEDREGAARYVEKMLVEEKDAELMEVLSPTPGKMPAEAIKAARPPPVTKKVKGSETLPMFNLKTKSGKTITNPAMVLAKLKNDNPLETRKQIEKIAKKAGQWREVTEEGWNNIMNALRKAPTVGELAATGWAGRASRWWYQDDEIFFKKVLGKDTYKFFGVMAATSPQAKAETENIRYGINAWTDYINLREKLGREPNREEITELVSKMDVGIGVRRGGVIRVLSGEQLGKSEDTLKTRFYHNALFGIELGAVLDIWHGRGMGQLKFTKEGEKISLVQDFGDSIVYSILSDRMDKAAETLDVPQSASQASQWSLIKALWDRMGPSRNKRKYGGIEALKSLTNKNIADAGNYTTGIANYYKEGHPIIDKIVAMGIPREEIAKLKTAAEQLEGRGIDPNASIYRDAPPAIQKELERLALRLEKTRDIIDSLKAQEAHAKKGDPSLYMSLETTHGPFAGLPWTKRLAMHSELRSGPLSDAAIKTVGMTFGLKVTGVVDGPGDWYNPKTKKTEINPNFSVLMAVPPGKTKKELAKAIQGFGATLAYATRQAAVGFTHPVAMDPLFEPHGGPVVIIDIGRTISKEQAAALSKAMAETFPEDTAFKVPTSNGFIITMPKYDEGYPLSYVDFSRNVLKSLDKAGINNVKGIRYFEKDILEGGDYYEGRRDGEDVAGGVSPYTDAIRDSRGPRGIVRADKLLSRTDAIKEKYATEKIRKELRELEESRGVAVGQPSGLAEGAVREKVDLSLRTKAALSKPEMKRVSDILAKDPAAGSPVDFKNKEVILTHWSKLPNLKQTDPSKHGTGYAGAELKAKDAHPDLWFPKTYTGFGTYTAEAGLGRYRYQISVPGNNIYDAWEDPLKLWPSAEETRKLGYYTKAAQGLIHEQRMKDVGYDGYASTPFQIVVLFNPVAVSKAEASDKVIDQPDYSLRTIISAITNRPMSETPTPPSTGQRTSFDSPEVTPLNKFLYKMVDRQIGITDLQRSIKNFGNTISSFIDAALREVLYSGRVGARVGDFLKNELRPIYQALSAVGFKTRDELDDFQEYIYVRHAKEANTHVRTLKDEEGNLIGLQDGGSGITDDKADTYMKDLDPALQRKYEPIARMVDKLTHKSAQLQVDYFLESQDTIDKMLGKYSHYVPLFREDIEEGTIGSGTGASITGPTHKARKGSLRAVQVPNILANIANQRERIISRGEKNTLAAALYGLAKANPNPDYWKIARPGIKTERDIETGTQFKRVDLSYRQRDNVVMHRTIEKGKVVEKGVEFNTKNDHAKRTANAIKNLDMDTLGAILGTSAKVTRFISAMNTQYNPIFGITNFVRDVGFAMLTLSTTPIAGKQAAVLRKALPNILGIYKVTRGDTTGKIAKDFDRLRMAGGLTGYRDLFKTTEKRTNALTREFETLTKGGILKGGYAIKNWLSDYNLAMESAIRLAAFQVGIESGMSEDKAAAMAKSLTVNFNRKGQIATQAGAMYAFFNASVQGIDKMVETLRGPMGRRIIGGGLAFGILQAAVLAAAGFGEDEPPEWVQERNIIIPLGGGRYHTIPMPLGFNVIPNIGRVSAQIAMTGFKDPGKRMANLFGMIVEAFSPLGSSGMSLQTFFPTPLDPFVALAENKDWTGKPIYREDFSKLDPTPGEARARENADFISKLLAQGLNRLSGGTAHTPGLLSPTPEQLAYLVGQAGGGVAREAEKAVKTLETLVTGEELPPYKIPIVSRFYGTTEGKAQQSSKFYENIKSMNIHENEIQGRKKTGKSPEDYFKEHPEAVLYKAANRAEASVSKLNKKRRELVERDAPKEVVRTMENLIAVRMGAFNSQVAQARR